MEKNKELFIGEYRHQLDTKGRLTVPRRFRQFLGDDTVITAGYDGALECWRSADFHALADSLLQLSFQTPENRRLLRRSLAMASNQEFDRLGRLLLPRSLINHADLAGEVLILGLGNRLELWNPSRYQEWLALSAPEPKDGQNGAN